MTGGGGCQGVRTTKRAGEERLQLFNFLLLMDLCVNTKFKYLCFWSFSLNALTGDK